MIDQRNKLGMWQCLLFELANQFTPHWYVLPLKLMNIFYKIYVYLKTVIYLVIIKGTRKWSSALRYHPIPIPKPIPSTLFLPHTYKQCCRYLFVPWLLDLYSSLSLSCRSLPQHVPSLHSHLLHARMLRLQSNITPSSTLPFS